MLPMNDTHKVRIWLAAIAAISAIAVTTIKLYQKNEPTPLNHFQANDISGSSVIIGSGNNIKK